MFIRIEVLDVVHRLKQHDKYLVVRFLALVTTMVTKVDYGNHRSNNPQFDQGMFETNFGYRM